MTKEDDFKLLKFQTCDLRVNIHCDGCRLKVKKLLQRTEGVFQVVIGAENQKVTVVGSVDSATLINKLVRAGKHAELWSQKANTGPKPKNKDDKSPNKGPKPSMISLNCEDDEIDGYLNGEEGEDCEAPVFQFRAANLDLLRQQAMDVNNAKKGNAIVRIPGPATGNGKMNLVNNIKPGNGKKIDSHQPISFKNIPSDIDQKTLEALKMNNAQAFGTGRGSINPGEPPRGNNNDLNSMMNMAGFNGSNVLNFATPSTNGANSTINSQGGLHLQHNNNGYGHGYQPSSTGGFSMATGQFHHQQQQQQPTSINGYNNQNHQQQQQQQQQPFMNMNNMVNRQAMSQQAQMMYNRAQLVPPNTGYYYNYNPSPVHPSYPFVEAGYYQHGHSTNSAAEMFSDENTSSSCSIM